MKISIFIIVVFSLIAYIPLFGGENQTKPNIIFFLADDMRTGVMGCEGNTIIKTPSLDQLAANGVRFNNAFVTTSICCCSRASILTGQYVSKHGINDFNIPLTKKAFSQTYPMLLKKAGYQVGFIGKYGIGENTTGVEELFDYFWGTAAQPDYENEDGEGDYIHYTDLVAGHINEFLKMTDSEKPFCLSVSFKSPHCQDGDPRQFIYNPRFKELHTEDHIPEEPTNTIEEWEKFPAFFQENNEGRKRWKIRFSTPSKYQEMTKGYYRLITGLDEVIGKVRKTLQEKGIDKNTIIVFFSDNGFYLGEHGLAGKWYGHEPSIRVPFIIYNPADMKNRGKVISDIVLNIDIAPTILAYAGVEANSEMQGKNLVSLVHSGSEKSWRSSFYYEHNITQFTTIPCNQALRTQRYKYIVYPESSPLYEEVYDLQEDPSEINNLALNEEYKPLLEQLRSEFKKMQLIATEEPN